MSYTIINIIQSLNTQLYDLGYDDGQYEFEYYHNGCCEVISFSGHVLWNSEEDYREWSEEFERYEPLDRYIIKQFEKFKRDLNSITLEPVFDNDLV